jgi:hypothetical protein
MLRKLLAFQIGDSNRNRGFRLTATMASALLTAVLLTTSPAAASAASSGCNSLTAAAYGTCTLSYPDQASNTYGTLITPALDKCVENKYGLELATGYDLFLNMRLTGTGLDGFLTGGTSIPFDITTGQDCRAWKNAYKFEATLVGPDGQTYTSSAPQVSSSHQDWFSEPLGSYCFYNDYCQINTFHGAFSLPISAAPGQYQIRLKVDYESTSASYQFSPVHFDWTFTGALSKPVNNAVDFPKFNSVMDQDGGLVSCHVGSFTPYAIDTWGLKGLRWVIRDETAGSTLDTFDTQIDGNAPLPWSEHQNGKQYPQTNVQGQAVFGYSVKSQTRGNVYSCGLSTISNAGVSPATVTTYTATVDAADYASLGLPKSVVQPTPLVIAKKSIRCVNNKNKKMVKQVTSTNPRCPSGYSQKNN